MKEPGHTLAKTVADQERRVYDVLAELCGDAEHWTGAQSELAVRCGMSVRTLSTWLVRLRGRGCVATLDPRHARGLTYFPLRRPEKTAVAEVAATLPTNLPTPLPRLPTPLPTPLPRLPTPLPADLAQNAPAPAHTASSSSSSSSSGLPNLPNLPTPLPNLPTPLPNLPTPLPRLPTPLPTHLPTPLPKDRVSEAGAAAGLTLAGRVLQLDTAPSDTLLDALHRLSEDDQERVFEAIAATVEREGRSKREGYWLAVIEDIEIREVRHLLPPYAPPPPAEPALAYEEPAPASAPPRAPSGAVSGRVWRVAMPWVSWAQRSLERLEERHR